MAAKKKKNSKQSPIMLILLVGVVALGGYFMLTGNDPLGLFTEVVTPTPAGQIETPLALPPTPVHAWTGSLWDDDARRRSSKILPTAQALWRCQVFSSGVG